MNVYWLYIGKNITWIINRVCQGKHHYYCCSYLEIHINMYSICMNLNIARILWFVSKHLLCGSGSYRMVGSPHFLDCWNRWQSFRKHVVLHISSPSWSTSTKMLWRPTTPATTSKKHSTRLWRWAVSLHIEKTVAMLHEDHFQIKIYIEEKVQLKRKISWKFTHSQTIQDVDEFVSSSAQIWRDVMLHHLLTNGSSAANGCHQYESPDNW